jgi:phage regulator Rha-like protein
MKQRWQPHEIQFLIDNYQKFSSREMAEMLNRDYSSTKRKIKKHILDIQDGVLPDGFVIIPTSPIHAVNNT